MNYLSVGLDLQEHALLSSAEPAIEKSGAAKKKGLKNVLQAFRLTNFGAAGRN
ncbi:MAG: hypothetical protein V4633_22455 [Pseudomonadota bacterium]